MHNLVWIHRPAWNRVLLGCNSVVDIGQVLHIQAHSMLLCIGGDGESQTALVSCFGMTINLLIRKNEGCGIRFEFWQEKVRIGVSGA
jgi:hypothetical protein